MNSDVMPLPGSRRFLLVNPEFPIPYKSRNHKDYLPVGLLKISRWLEHEGCEVKLVYGNLPLDELCFRPDEVWITSLFTYWSDYVVRSAEHYRRLFSRARIVVGGIYATLKPEDCKRRTHCDAIQRGVHSIAEQFYPDYDKLNGEIDFQVVHASRGCIRRCKFCYTHIIEPEYVPKRCILSEIVDTGGRKLSCASPDDVDLTRVSITRKGLVFYDNNLLANEHIEELLAELIQLRKKRLISWCESQSGFDGRLLEKKPDLAEMLKKAGFRVPRIAWDWGFSYKKHIEKQIEILEAAGYKRKEIFVFMIYNWDIPFLEMEDKRIACFEWGVQISDCRYRPIDQLYDNYDPHRWGQIGTDYYIHYESGWDDYLVKQFRKNVREQNICVRHGYPIYVKAFERKKPPRELVRRVKDAPTLREKIQILESAGIREYWVPSTRRLPRDYHHLAKASQAVVLDF